MPDLGERALCSEKIFVPPSFPSIMKGYCKAAIRTQPYDLLRWSAAYFRALANGENPPVKERLEFPPTISPPGLTQGYLKVLVNQLGKDPERTVTSSLIAQKWNALCLPNEDLEPLLSLMETDNFPWLRLLAVAAGSVCSTLTQTMILLCELLTEDLEGGKAAIPLDIFLDLYQYLANLDCGPATQDMMKINDPDMLEMGDDKRSEDLEDQGAQKGEIGFPGIGTKLPAEQVEKVVQFMTHWAGRQDGMVMPRNIRHWMCPPLDLALLL